MPITGIEPATLRSLARRSNQLSYAAARSRIEKYHQLGLLQVKVVCADKSLHVIRNC